MNDSYDKFEAERLNALARDIFQAQGQPDADAQTVADGLLRANLRGVDSHGVARVPASVSYRSNLVRQSPARVMTKPNANCAVTCPGERVPQTTTPWFRAASLVNGGVLHAGGDQ